MSRIHDEIRNLLFTYAARIDAGDFDGVGELFREATYRSADGVEFRGAKAVRDVLAAVVILYEEGTPRTKHVTTNVTVDADEATGRASAHSYFTVMQALDDFPLQAIVAGRYEDRFVCENGVWRFEDRLVTMELFGDLSRHLRFDPKPKG